MPNTLKLRKIILLGGDIGLLYLSLLGMVFFGFWGEFNWQIVSIHILPFSILYFFWLIVFYIIGLYDLNFLKTHLTFYARLLFGLGVILVIGVFFFYFTPFFDITPKTNLFLNILIFGTLTVFWRKTFFSLFSARFQNKTAIVGQSPQLKELIQIIQKNPQLGYKIVAFFDSSKTIFKEAQKKEIDTLIFAKNLVPGSLLAKNLYQCLSLKIDFIDLAKAYEIIIQKIPIAFVEYVWFLENLRETEKGLYEKVKQGTDIILAGILIILTLPFWLFIALAIKLEDKGAILYFQERIGKNKKPFLLIKFRSMKKGAEKYRPVWAKRKDSRITNVGKFLRRFHLDEIPQMINILKGDISLVGPRPERPEFVQQLEKEIPHYHLRHLIKPGFTGWAQIKFRYARTIMDSFEKFQYDLYYLKNRSFFLDLCILLKTLQLLFKKE